jgi:uncharacterized protein
MTATTTPPQQSAISPASARPGRRIPRWLVAAGLLLGIAVLAATLRPGQPLSMPGPEMDSAVRGAYRLPDGELLTLFGSSRMPRYELADHVTQLLVDGTDTLVSVAGDEALAVVRDEAGAITGLRLQREGEPPASAARAPVHAEQEVRYESDGVLLAGTLLLPDGPGPHPAVVFAHGAGPEDRHGNFRLLGSHLARRGVATLVYDKRGVGDSTGSYTGATFDDLTADALAGFDLLASHPDVDPDRVGVAGFSQSGWTVAEAAQRRDDIAFVVAMSPSGFAPADQQAWLHGSMLAVRGFDRSAMTIADRVGRMLYSSLDLVDAGLMPAIPQVPGFWFHALDPYQATTELWQGVRQPTLLVWGANDCQVPAHDSMAALGDALRRGGNAHVTMAVLAGADHSLTREGPCAMETTGHHDTYAYADGVLAMAAEWINGLPGEPEAVPLAPRPETGLLAWHVEPPIPAPWYGTLAAQLAAILLLLGLFGFTAGRWAVAAARSGFGTGRPPGWGTHLVAAAALSGLAATASGIAAFTEIAVLGGVHAAPLVGPPQVDGTSVLMMTARTLVLLTAALSAAAIVVTIRRPNRLGHSVLWTVLAGVALLSAWAGYWQLLPLA